MAATKRKAAGAGLPAAKHSSVRLSKAEITAEAPAGSNVDMAPSDEGSSDAGDSDEEMGSDVDADQDVSKPLDPSGNGSAGPLAPERKKGTGTRPTNAEIMALNEASMLFKSNLFRLQIDELLGETLVAADTKPTRGLDAALKQIRDVLVSMEGTKEMSIDAAASLVRRLGKDAAGEVITIPFADPAPAPGLAVKLAFAAPEVVNVVGSYPLGMAVHTHGGFNVDVVVQMPPQLLQERDHLNYRYFYKRAFYVAMVRVRMHKSALNELFDIGFELLRNDTRLPVVVLRPKADTKHLGKLGCAIRIIPSISRESLPLHRMSPTRNHVRPSYILEAGGATVEGDTAGAEPPATPQYNAAVLADALLLTHMKYLFETTEMCPEFPRGAALLRIWLAQRVATGRQIGTRRLLGTRRINGFVLTMVLAWLVRVPRTGTSAGTRLTGSMNAHQLFKGAVEFLASHDFGEDPVQFGGDADMYAFCGSHGAVFVDPSATTNLLAGAQAWELLELRMEARQTALDLNHHSEHQFDRVFLSAALTEITAKYDHLFRLEVDLAQFLSPRFGSGLDAERRLAELECGHPVVAVQSHIARFLGAALQRQSRLVAVHPCADASFGDRTKSNRRHVFYIGVVADTAEARRLVDLGPNPDAQPQDAADFRQWWGERAELRRFRDGSIRLATVWGENGMSFESRALILPRMVAYLLRRHFSVGAQPEILLPEDMLTVDSARPAAAAAFGAADAPQAGRLFGLSGRIALFASTRDLAESEADKITFEAAIGGLDQLQRDIKGLEDQLPLRVLAFHPVAPGLRYASLAPPKPLPIERGGGDDAYIEPLHVLLEFASSTKWPSDMVALHKVKSAFLLRLVECYTAAHPGVQATAGNRLYGYGAADGLLTGGSPATLGASADDFDYEHDNFVDIRHAASGLSFRLSILCEAEGALLEEKAQELRLAGLAPRAAALDKARSRWLRCNQWRARHHRRILDLCQRHHPAASMTIRLLKRWLSRHMLLGQPAGVPEEAAELIAARVFTDAWSGLAAPASGYAGFVRCLQLLATWQWKDDLCVVDFSAVSSDDASDSGSQGASPLAYGVWVAKGMPADAYAVLQTAFDDEKKRDQVKGALRIASEDDPDAQRWGSVSLVLTRRMRSMAAASLREIARCLDAGTDASLPQVFTTPLGDYDFVIKLDKDAVCRRYEQPPRAAFETADGSAADGHGKADGADGKEVFKNLLLATQQGQRQGQSSLHPRVKQHDNPFGQPGMVGFDPVALFVRDLVSVYRDSLLVFSDMYGGEHIAGLWNPAIVRQPVPFVAAMQANMQPVPGEKMGSRAVAKGNTAAMVEEIARLGEGLIEDMVIQNK